MHASSRKLAIDSGLSHYFTGLPCKNGHIERRLAKSSHCLGCLRMRAEQRKQNDPDAYFAYAKELRGRKSSSGQVLANERKRAKYASDPEFRSRQLRNAKEWASQNKGHRLASYHKRERAKKASGDHFTGHDVKQVLASQKEKCANCLSSIRGGYHVDHIVPLARGGTNDRYNIQLLCPPCNIKKSSLDPVDWANRNGRLL